MPDGWAKIKAAAKYAGISERTMRDWLKQGLHHARLPSRTVLVKYSDIDEFLSRFIVEENEVDAIVDEVLKSFRK